MPRPTVTASKPWWQSRTVWLGLLELAAGLLDVLADSGLTGEAADGALLAAAGVLTVLLRYFTSQPIDCSGLSPRRGRKGTRR